MLRDLRVGARFVLHVFIDQTVLFFTGLKVDVADIQRNFVILVQRIPQLVSESVDIVVDRDSLGLTLEGRDRVAVADIGMDEVTESCLGRIAVQVARAITALRIDGEKILKLVDASGRSSFELLQNCYVNAHPEEQKISLCLALTTQFINKIGKGVCRVHGGGFAGVIMAILPSESVQDYIKYMGQFVGEKNVYLMNIRKVGAAHIEA